MYSIIPISRLVGSRGAHDYCVLWKGGKISRHNRLSRNAVYTTRACTNRKEKNRCCTYIAHTLSFSPQNKQLTG